MNELNRTTPGQPQEKPSNTADQDVPAETGLMLLEKDDTFEKSDIDALQQKAGELHGINEAQRGLEGSIIGAGLQVMVDRYGADIFLDATQGYDKDGRRVGSLQDVIQKLAPEKGEQKALYEAIKAEPIDELAERFNQTLGGVADGNTDVSAMERFRRYEMFSVENKRVMQDANGNRIHRGRDTGGYTDSAGLLLTGDFDKLLSNHPDLVENFRESNDTLGLLKDIRDIYETEYAQFAADLEQAKVTVEERVAEGEAGVAELQTLADDIDADEVAKLEERLAAASSEDAKELIQGRLEKKTDEVVATREEFTNKMEAVRSKIVADLGADRLYQLPVAAPARAQPTHNDKEWHAA